MKWLLVVILAIIGVCVAQEKTCERNQVLNGQQCTCAAGYFETSNESQCEDECEEVYYTLFTYGTCAGDLFGRLKEGEQQPACNRRCGVRFRLWTTVFIFALFAAAVCTLFFTLPMCIATCGACLQAKKANRNTKKTTMGIGGGPHFADGHASSHVTSMEIAKTHQGQPQMQTMAYNPYAYWPYYGRGM